MQSVNEKIIESIEMKNPLNNRYLINQDDVISFLWESNKIENERSITAMQDALSAWTWGVSNFDLKKNKITISTILNIHEKIMYNLNRRIAGKIRDKLVMVGGRVCPEPELVETMLDEWIEDYGDLATYELRDEKDHDDIVREVKEAHIDFERIHPFEDGNGRTGRIIMNLQLYALSLPLMIIKEIEKREYYRWFTQK